MQQQLKETVFLPAALEANLDNMLADINARLSRDIRQSGDRLLPAAAGYCCRFLACRVREPVFGDSLNLDEMFASGVQLSSRDLNRQVVAALAATGTGVVLAKGVGAVVVKKTLAKVAGTKSFHVASALLAKLVAKSAVKGGGMLAGAGAGTAICSPAGPGALVCGAIGGWLWTRR